MKALLLVFLLIFTGRCAVAAEPPDKSEVLTPELEFVQEQSSSKLMDLNIENAQANVRAQLERLQRPIQRPQISVFGAKVRASSESAQVDSLLEDLKINQGTRTYDVPENMEYCGHRVTELSAGGARNDELLRGNKYGRSYAYAVSALSDRQLQVNIATTGSTHLGQGRAWIELLVELFVVPRNTSEVHRKIMGCTWPATEPKKQVCVCQVTPFEVVRRANCWDKPNDFNACAATWTKDYSRCIAPGESCSKFCTTFERPYTVRSDICYQPNLWQPDEVCRGHLKSRREARDSLLALLETFPKNQRRCIQFNNRQGECAAIYSELAKSRPAAWSSVKALSDSLVAANGAITRHEAVSKRACGDFK